jgi:hypothetical protein
MSFKRAYAAIFMSLACAGPAFAQTGTDAPHHDAHPAGAAQAPNSGGQQPRADNPGNSPAANDHGATTVGGSPGSYSVPGSAGQGVSETR